MGFTCKNNLLKRFWVIFLIVLLLGCRSTENNHVAIQEVEKPSSQDNTVEKTEFVNGESTINSEELENKDDSSKITPLPVVSPSPISYFSDYQLGDNWSRRTTPAFHNNHRTVFRGTVATDFGLISSNFIVLKLISEDEALFVAAIHAFPQCAEEGVILRSKEMQIFGFCGGIYTKVPETDAVIFSLKFFEEDITEFFEPVEFASVIERGERLRFFSMGKDDLISGYYPLYSDSDIDCLMMSAGERKISDPDTANPIRGVDYWSFAVSCDMLHGDSGGLLVNRHNEMVGMIWTGAYPKSMELKTDLLLKIAETLGVEFENTIWTQLNYAVPAYRIQDHLQSLLKESTPR